MINLINELKEPYHVREFVAKHKASRRYNSRVKPREMQEGDLVLMEVVLPVHHGILQLNWEGSYCIFQKLPREVYKLQELKGSVFPRTWNALHLRYYYS